jgi:heme/copper-type cytochrome/quinol oxidase subunit 1
MVSSVWWGLVGLSLRVLIRVELGHPGGVMCDDQVYYSIVTSHAFIMIFFLVIPAIMGGFGNWFVPIILGSPDMSFPRLNNVSFWLLVGSGLLIGWSMVVESGCGTG